MYQEPFAGAADLPSVAAAGTHCLLYSQINIRILPDDKSVVSAKFQKYTGEIGRGVPVIRIPVSVLPVMETAWIPGCPAR